MIRGISESLRRVRADSRVLATTVVFLCVGHLGHAQWTNEIVSRAWTGFNNAYYYTDSSGNGYYYRQEPNVTDSGNSGGFWQSAERIEMAIDMYYWDTRNNPGNAASDKSRITALCNGFRNLYGDEVSTPSTGAVTNNGWGNWTPADDDLQWAGIAFARAYTVTGSTTFLTDAEGAFDEVYTRGYDSTYGGGIWWDSRYKTAGGGSSDNKCACSNFPFAILGILLYGDNGITRYQTEANSVYSWAKSNLINTSTGEVANDIEGNPGAPNWGAVTYNYGTAIGAANEHGDSSIIAPIADYVINNVYETTVDGYHILPNYGQAGNGFGLFNGILFRWEGIADGHGSMPSDWLAWAQENISLAWSNRNPYALTWDNFDATTPSSGLYSNDCTSMVVGMAFVAPPS